MRKITIAIDGYSSTGKSTLAKRLATALDYVYVDTGAMYRAVTLFALDSKYLGDGEEDIPGLIQELPKIDLKFVPNKTLGKSEMFMNGKNVEQETRTMHVSKYVSRVAAIEEVRHMLVKLQQEMGNKEKGIVMDGRDIGTVVFPNAELKFFMTASPNTRATRRYKELLDKGEEVSFEEVLENVQKRDFIDSTRAISPLRKADDAIEFDNSDMGLDEQFERVHNYTLRVLAEKE
ncbi:(d)CMP kinase [Flagellimonas sp. HMM57]|uniref:(d)CMP kinase n=1 Tax=unclassified Flagellimonas TaxID=2644544 RepID=UPI0013D1D87C|nr:MULTISPECIES: (d)CMP kinase [unclassified Flagellimonas]UII76329.1 (d)CMP kinase [Flagellimonas sp. HMM57]